MASGEHEDIGFIGRSPSGSIQERSGAWPILARDLGVVIDSGLTMSHHVTAVCRSAYYQLRQLHVIAHSLSDDAATTLVQAFISCRLDYYNALLSGISDALIQHLQSGAELCSAAGYRGSSVRPHHTGTETAPLAACKAVN